MFWWAKENYGYLKKNKNENIEDGSTKKVYLKEQCVDLSVVMAVDLVLINGILQQVEYKYIPRICFARGLYEHVKEICSNMEPCLMENDGVPPTSGKSLMVDAVMVDNDRVEETCAYRLWVLVERKPRHNSRDSHINVTANQGDMIVDS
ncbi:hypothetical protein PVK06_040750 [Gossypium arboreum]|uniref:Uncharacterized protein n=1 Tax=Gossypium arboreum TaxID=29729 RepID=A0ABR0N749_GOSAR|nr:hypothetical protein PVK06_040750 [Gossypium arboreum]